MAISIVNVVVPVSGDGPSANISSLVGTKTVELSGQFKGRYILLGSQNDVKYVPVAIFDANGIESIKITLDLALTSVKVRSEALSPVGVTMNVSGVVGVNLFAAIASIPAGGSGDQPIIDLNVAMPPSGIEQGIAFLCNGSFTGLLTIEGSLDGVNFNPIGDGFRGDTQLPSLLGTSAPLEFSPLVTQDLVRYVRVSLNGVASTDVVVTLGGFNPAGGSTGTAMPIFVADANGGVLQSTGTPVSTTVTPSSIVAGYGATANAGSLGSIVIGTNAIATDGASSSLLIGTSARADQGAAQSIVIGESSTATNGASLSLILGRAARVEVGHSIVIGYQASVIQGGDSDIAIGQGATVSQGVVRGIAIGDHCLLTQGSTDSIVVGTGAYISNGAPTCIVVGPGSLAVNVTSSVVIGTSAASNNGTSHSVVIGDTAVATNGSFYSVVIGTSTLATSSNSTVVIGLGASADNSQDGVVLGHSATVYVTNEPVVVGAYSSIRYSQNAIIVGVNSSIQQADNAIIVGPFSSTITQDAILIGRNITDTSDGPAGAALVAIGHGITIGSSTPYIAHNIAVGVGHTIGQFGVDNIVVGSDMALGDAASRNVLLGRVIVDLTFSAALADNIILGNIAITHGDANVLIGQGEAGESSIIIGHGTALVSYGIAIGNGPGYTVTNSDSVAGSSIAIGAQATAKGNEAVIGANEPGSPAHGALWAINSFTVKGTSADKSIVLDIIKAINNPASGSTGLSVVYNNGAAYSDKTLKAAASPPPGSLLVYMDP